MWGEFLQISTDKVVDDDDENNHGEWKRKENKRRCKHYAASDELAMLNICKHYFKNMASEWKATLE